MIRKRGELMWDTLIPWMIAFGVLVLMLLLYLILSGKVDGAIQYFKDLLRFGR